MNMSNIVAIHITPEESGPMQSVPEVIAVAGKGLTGDRYFDIVARDGKTEKTGRHATLIETEALEALKRDYEMPLALDQSRRNILTRGVALNHLVGREFKIGDAVFRGIRLCEPCRHLEKMTGQPVMRGLLHRGGLRAEIVKGGVLRVGDSIQP